MNDFEKNIGKKVIVVGKISTVMRQHSTRLTKFHPYINYVDLDDTHQIIIYTKSPITCENKIELSGEVIKIESNEGDPRFKIHDIYTEYQLIVESWKCLD
jgi:hypothetical protein